MDTGTSETLCPAERFLVSYKGNRTEKKRDMSFRKWHRRAYIFWVIASGLVALSMIAFLLAPLLYS
jgi:hypothetical protein